MPTSLRAFHIGLYVEHLEDLSFLYEQRGALLRKTNQPWRDLAAFEARAEAHLDALIVGADLALGVCQRRAAEGDFGELYAAVCVYCRQRQSGLLAATLHDLDVSDPRQVSAVADALSHEMPDDWAESAGRALDRCDARLAPMLASVCGRRRLPFGPALARVFAAHGHGPGAERLAFGLGRVREREACMLMAELARRDDVPAARDAALLALLRLGVRPDRPQIVPADSMCRSELIALGGDREVARSLASAAQQGQADADSLLALGLLGDPTGLRALYDCLVQPELAESAALALHWISGAPMRREVFVPDEVSEEELIGQELRAWRDHHEPPRRLDGQPFGEKQKKISTEQEHWKQWFKEQAPRFDPELRYRRGQPCSPNVLVETLADPEADPRLRRFTAEELAVRYVCELPFETDMPVLEQLWAIDALRAWVAGQSGNFAPGRWFYNGQIQ